MAKRRKSKGFIQYERDIDAIRDRIKHGEIDDVKVVLDEMVIAFRRSAADMSKKEVRAFLAKALGAHTAAAKALAAEGHTVPGNDPKRPN
jgi:hypothetical protein